MKALAVLVLAAGLLPAADPKADELLKKEMERLQGSWTAQMLLVNGGKPEGDPTIRLTIKGDALTFKLNDQVVVAGTAKLEPGLDPKLFDLAITQGEPKGQTWEGIYKLDGDTFTFCIMLKEKRTAVRVCQQGGFEDGAAVFKRDKP